MTDRAIRLGMIGGGMMSQVGHLPFLLADARCRVAAVAESRPSLVEALEKDRRIARVVTDYRAVLADPAIDAVVISLPRGATAPVTLQALEAGKHVLAEKPMALTAEDAQRLVAAAASRQRTYAVGFMKRYDPGVQAARATFLALLADGRLGRLLLARFYNFSKSYAVPVPAHVRPKESRVDRFPESAPAPAWLPREWHGAYGWFVNAAIHDLNLMHFFLPGDIAVTAASSPQDGAISAILRHGETAIHLEIAKSAVGVWREGAEFLFESGRLRLEVPSPMAVDQVARVTLEENTGAYRRSEIATGSGWCFARQAAGFIDALSGTAAPLASGADCLRDMHVTDSIWQRVAGRHHG